MGLGRISAARNVIQKRLPTKAVRLFGVVELAGPAKLGHILKLLGLQAWLLEVVLLVLLVLLMLLVLVARENVAHQVTAGRVPLGQLRRTPRVPEPRCEGEALVKTALARLQRGPVRGGVYLPFGGHGCPDALLERIAARALERQKLRRCVHGRICQSGESGWTGCFLGSTLGCVVAEVTMPLEGWVNLVNLQPSLGLVFGLWLLVSGQRLIEIAWSGCSRVSKAQTGEKRWRKVEIRGRAVPEAGSSSLSLGGV